MLVKIIKECWYNEIHYNPDIEGSIIIEFTGKKLPSWAEEVDAKATKKLNKTEATEDSEEVEAEKVNQLPLTEKNTLLEAAKAVGIEGNNILSWKVSTLKSKIEAAKKGEE